MHPFLYLGSKPSPTNIKPPNKTPSKVQVFKLIDFFAVSL